MIGRRPAILLAAIGITFCATGGNWTMFGFGPNHPHSTPDKTISPKNLFKLARHFTVRPVAR
ncbi:MAG TPA: hypothetical protein VMV06_08935 [Acidimicrobiales bacterium]|nr:hypothetical protein [Acidimicrobiales bacterium]